MQRRDGGQAPDERRTNVGLPDRRPLLNLAFRRKTLVVREVARANAALGVSRSTSPGSLRSMPPSARERRQVAQYLLRDPRLVDDTGRRHGRLDLRIIEDVGHAGSLSTTGHHPFARSQGTPLRSVHGPQTACDKGIRLPQERKSGANLGLRLTTPDHETEPLAAENSANAPSQSDVVIWGDRSSTCCLLEV